MRERDQICNVLVIGGVVRKVHSFAFDPTQRDAPFVKATPAETSELFSNRALLIEGRESRRNS